MNLPVESQLELRKSRKIWFHSNFMYVAPLTVGNEEKLGVLIEESHADVRIACYRQIWRVLKYNDRLRGSLELPSHVTLRQVIDQGGYGVVTTSPPEIGRFVLLTWHPRIKNRLYQPGMRLGMCGLGQVTHPPEQAA